MTKILVTGATGMHGGAVLRALLAAEHEVSALVRDATDERAIALRGLGAELVVGDMTDELSLRAAFASHAAIYAITTPFADGPAGEVRQGEAIVGAARAVAAPWLILASVAAADRAPVPHFQSKAQIESALRRTELDWTVIAPSYFFENVSGGVVDGTLELAMPATKSLHQLALRNLGEVVAAILDRREEHLRARLELAGDAPTPREMADALGAHFQEVPLALVAERNPDIAAMYGFLAREGYGVDVAAVRARYPEVAWLTFAAWAATEGDE